MKPFTTKALALVALSAAALAPSAHALDGKEGGGGAGFCVNGKCITLAEAGLKIKEPPYQAPGYLLRPELAEEAQRIVQSLPWEGRKRYRYVLGGADTFQLVEQLHPKRFRKAMDEYRAVIAKHGLQVDPSLLTLFAFSDRKHTYLLPKFFELTLRQQALYLIHETHIRMGNGLEETLKFDIQLDAWTRADAGHFDAFPLAYYAEKLGWADTAAVTRHAVAKVARILGRPLSPADLCEGFSGAHVRSNGCDADRSSVLRLSAIDPRLAYVFANARVRGGMNLHELMESNMYHFEKWFLDTPKTWPELEQGCGRSGSEWIFVTTPPNLKWDELLLVECPREGVEPKTYMGSSRNFGLDIRLENSIVGLNFLPLLSE